MCVSTQWTLDILAWPSWSRTVCEILARNDIKPHNVRYYLERRDEAFETKMAELLHVYGAYPVAPFASSVAGRVPAFARMLAAVACNWRRASEVGDRFVESAAISGISAMRRASKHVNEGMV